MSKLAWAYMWGVFLGAAALSVAAWQQPHPANQLVTLTVLAVITTAAHLFEAEAPNRQSYYPSMIFLFAGVLLLAPGLFVLLAILPHLIEWVKERVTRTAHLRAWYIQPFNIATHIVAGLSAGWMYYSVIGNTWLFHGATSVIAATIAALTYVMLNHMMVGLVLVLARGISWQDSGVLELENLLPDFVNLCLGYIVAIFWMINFWLILPVLSPIVLIYRALTVPQLKQEAQTDTKTGLLNARYFNKLFLDEFERAQRFDRPLSLIVADLDLMRNINNTYGHLAGDVVLGGIGKIIHETVRKYDIAGRFGGEEFCIVLPEVGPEVAKQLAERLRAAVEAGEFVITTQPEPIRATMSIGIACFPQDASTTTDLMHAADVAVYQAKLGGRNRVAYVAEVPHSITVEEMQTEYRAGLQQAPVPASTDAPAPGEQPGLAEQASAPAEQPATPAKPEPAPLAAMRPVSATARAQPETRSHPIFWIFASGVISAGVGVALYGFTHFDMTGDLAAIGLLTLLALIAELLHVNVYDGMTFSVSVAMVFAVALIGGVVGVASVTTMIVLIHYIQRRPAFYKVAFNWATHMLSGMLPVIAFKATGASLSIEHLYLLLAVIALTGIAHYMTESWLFATFIGLSTGRPLRTQWQEQFGWLASHYAALCVMGLFLSLAYTVMGAIGLFVFTLPVLMMRFAHKQYTERTEDGIRELKRMNQELQRANGEIVTATQSIRQLNDELFQTLAKIIDARDPYASGHASKVADYALLIARELQFDFEQQNFVYQAGLLHDIGKLGIPEEILNKPGRLSDEEYAKIKTHAALGAEFLETCQGLRHLAGYVRHHHERWDGHGYPDGLAGETIPLIARILNVCDSVEAMASDRPYHKGMTPEHIIDEVVRQSGKQFDPQIAELFMQIVAREGRQLITNTAHAIARRTHAPPQYKAPSSAEQLARPPALEKMAL